MICQDVVAFFLALDKFLVPFVVFAPKRACGLRSFRLFLLGVTQFSAAQPFATNSHELEANFHEYFVPIRAFHSCHS
jgi:hypothetical protein